MPSSQYFLNPLARSRTPDTGLFAADEYRAVDAFFQSQPQLGPTPLRSLRGLASELRQRDLLLKDEAGRAGLNSFKILGVAYAVHRLLDAGRLTKESVVVCATEGNHGRAVAHVAARNGLSSIIYVSQGVAPSRVEAIAREGARVEVVAGGYDEAVRLAAENASRHGWTVVSDTSWQGYEEVPRWIMAGYTRLCAEAEGQWGEGQAPDVVLVQAGVGGLACGVVSWLCQRFGARRPYTVVCEPSGAASLLESARAGRPVALAGPFDTIMAGLRCGEVSPLAWPVLAASADAFVAVDDEWSAAAMRLLARPRGPDPLVRAGASGACGLAALLSILNDEQLRPLLEASGLDSPSSVLLINTEGVTDPELYDRITGDAATSGGAGDSPR